ncbi:MAG: signal peptidase I [Defluviitaleaceae bacterium]|nr:signal peptidase I [Defluviitaleaceae bacterium]
MFSQKEPPRVQYKPVVKALNRKSKPNNGEIPDVKKELWQEVLSWAKTIIFVLLFAAFFNNIVIVNAWVPTPSMENTIQTNDRLVAFRLSYLFREPQRYDIVVFGRDGSSIIYVKRIIGLPGESLIIINGQVYINGSDTPQRSDFVKGPIFGDHGVRNPETGVLEPFIIPEGHFFVLGDYRSNSADSRLWQETFVPRGRLLGRAVFRYFPGFANLSRQ